MEEIRNRSRRAFMVAGSAAVVSPMLLNLADPVKAAALEAKKAKKEKIYYITTKCVGCHACKCFCPQKAIYYGVRKMEIDQDKCVQCGTCYNECPISGIEEIKL
jgi:Pyruvate/2-oxoacid:ferredoxin oxidoreductase delta subunit